MGQEKEWLLAPVGSHVMLSDGKGRRVEGFLEETDPGLGIAWIRDHATGERRMLTRADYPHALYP